MTSNTATVAIKVNAGPSATADVYTTAQGAPLVVAAPGVLANGGDPDGDPLSAQLASGPAHGTLALSADGSFTYTPARGYFGQDSFVYRASDGQLESAAARVSIAVRPVCQGRPATIVGTAGRNVLQGTPRADVIVALGGNDLVRGGGGNDRVCAGDGADRVEGGAGADRLAGGRGNDLLLGGFGNDLLLGGPGNDTLRGGPGTDTCAAAPAPTPSAAAPAATSGSRRKGTALGAN